MPRGGCLSERSTIPWQAARPMSRNISFVQAMLCGASSTFSNSPKRDGLDERLRGEAIERSTGDAALFRSAS